MVDIANVALGEVTVWEPTSHQSATDYTGWFT